MSLSFIAEPTSSGPSTVAKWSVAIEVSSVVSPQYFSNTMCPLRAITSADVLRLPA